MTNINVHDVTDVTFHTHMLDGNGRTVLEVRFKRENGELVTLTGFSCDDVKLGMRWDPE